MLTRRNSTLPAEDMDTEDNDPEPASVKTDYCQKDQSQWMFIMNDNVLCNNPNEENIPMICSLRHPKSEEKALFIFSNGDRDVHEMIQYKEDFRSWLIGECVQHDGSMFMVTPVDPVFLVLPYLITASQRGKFEVVDQVVVDEDFPECRRLHDCTGLSELDNVADVKGTEDYKAFRYNKEKTMSWLKLKTERVAGVMERRGVCVSGARSGNYLKKYSPEDYLRYAFGVVSDYLPVDLASSLREHLSIPLPVQKRESDTSDVPSSKRSKLGDVTPTENYSQNGKPLLEKKDSKGKTSSKAQRSLDKVDKKGMKSMMSFFSPKGKS